MNNPVRISAKRAGEQVMKRYALALFGLVIVSALLAGAALHAQYRQLDEQSAQSLKATVNGRAAILSAHTAAASQQVKRARDSMENAMEDADYVSPVISKQLHTVNDADLWQKPAGSYWIAKTRKPTQIVEVLGSQLLATKINDPEVRAGFMIAKQFPADHQSNLSLFRSTYVSAKNSFVVAHSPTRYSMERLFYQEWQRDKGRTLAGILKTMDGFDAPPILAAKLTEDREVKWPPPRAPDKVDFVQLPLMAFVYRNGQLCGYVLMQYRASGLLKTAQAPGHSVAERFYILAPEDVIIDLGFKERGDVKVLQTLPGSLRTAAGRARLAPGNVINTESHRVIVAGIRGTPWQLLYVARNPSIASNLITEFLPTTLAILGLMGGSIFMLIGFRNSFLKPAITLLERAGSVDDSPPPNIGRMWAPWIDMLNQGSKDAAQYLQSLQEQSDLRSAILGSAIDGIVTSDEAGIITDFNPAAEAMFGWSRGDIIGKTMEETIVPPAFRHAHKSGMSRYLASGEARVIRRKVELQGLHRSGSLFPIDLAIAEASISGERIFIGYIRDLTTQQNSEAELLQSREALHQSEKLASLGSLLAGVAHELNNPLAIVVGRAAILEEKLAGSPLLPPLQKLRAAADRCSRIVKTFLAMARQSGPRRSQVQINELVEGALDMSAYGLRTNGVEVCLDLYPALPSTSADGDQLVQVLINLIVNAQQAMACLSGDHRLTIRTRHAQRTKSIILEVEDTGPGVPAKLVARIFEPFFTTKDVGDGTGMGLSVSSGMIEAHGGTLTLSRNGSRGTTFRVSLPITAGADASLSHDAVDLLHKARGLVLIVDDEPEIAELLADCLTPLGLVCDLASGGDEALKKISINRYDAIFTDMRMPGMDGLTLYQRLKASDPALAKKVAFVSGDVLHNEAARIAAIGDRLVIEKPFDPLQVREIALILLSNGDDR